MEFRFNHYIFASGAPPPVMTGEIKINVIRTEMFSFVATKTNWEESETCTEAELANILCLAEPAFNWEACEPTNEHQIRHRMSALLMHGDLNRDDPQVETVVTLFPGSSFQYGYGYSTDEGYASHGYDAEWNGVNGWDVEVNDEGRDCDGGINHHTTYSEDINGNPLSKRKTEVYDEFAQAAGY